MAKSVLDIVIKTVKEGGAEKETIQGLVNLKSQIMNAAGAAGMLVGAGLAIKKALDETVGSLVEYADKVRTVQNATGASAEDASKLIQVLDDQKVSYESLTKAIRTNGKEFDFSIDGIAKMSDEYLVLTDKQEQAEFMQKRYGKAWTDFVPVMQKGGAAIRAAADAVDESLILTQKAVDEARKYEIAMDTLGDSWEGLKITAGKTLIPAVNDVVNGFNVYIRAIEIARETGKGFSEATDQAGYEIWQEQQALLANKEALEESTAAEEDAAKALKEATTARQAMLGLITNIASETRNYEQRQTELTAKMAENRAEAEKLYPWQKQQLDELDAKYIEMQDSYNANAEAHRVAMGKIQYDLLVTKLSVDGITTSEFAMIQQAGLMFGVFDSGSVRAATNMNAVAEAVAAGRLRVQDMDAALRQMEKGYSIDVVLNTIQQMTGGWHAKTGTAAQQAGIMGGFAGGGIAPGPQSGHWELLHGTEAVIPLEKGSVPVQMQGGGGGNVNINLTISSPVTVMDQQQAQNVLLPFIISGVREARLRGAI